MRPIAEPYKICGFRHVVPTHQGRGAEHLISRTLFEQRDTIEGLEMVYEPPTLRFFTARFVPVGAACKRETAEVLVAAGESR